MRLVGRPAAGTEEAANEPSTAMGSMNASTRPPLTGVTFALIAAALFGASTPLAKLLLGEGIRLYDNPGAEPFRLHLAGQGDPTSAVNLRYRPITMAKAPAGSVPG